MDFFITVGCLIFVHLIEADNQTLGRYTSRSGKAFPLISFVSFPNIMCAGRGTFNGTCVASKECAGTIIGSCAGGYGTCCVYTLSCGSTSRANVTYFVNPSFPATYSEGGSCVFRVNKLNQNIVQLRLDFDALSINGVVNGQCSTDAFTVGGQNSDQRIPIICGQNRGQHIYVNVDRSNGPINLAVTTSGAGNRQWRIRVVQLERRNPGLAPNECLQYFTGLTGQIKSFNFDSPTPPTGQSNYITNLNYAICIEREDGMCESRFTATDELNSFDIETPDAMSGVDGSCIGDYLVIPGASNVPVAGTGTTTPAVGSRFCGVALSATPASVTSNPVRTGLSGPIQLAFVTNGQTPSGSSDRGFSIRYQQSPCSTTTTG
ncbi:hypothetical protein CHUAL_008455 [Chamberlinius hualienensis]